jgi:unsaturated rhamnogalacturonyl hydrolase
MRKVVVFLLIIACSCIAAKAQQKSYAAEIAKTAMQLWKDSFSIEQNKPAKWSYDQGVVLKGIEGLWNATGDGNYFNYIQKSMDLYVQNDGSIKGYKPDEYSLDNVNNGKLVLLLYNVTGKDKYKKAADLLRAQLKTQPRTSEGNFWHKKIYPSQVWLDGLYMAQPFYAQYAQMFGEDNTFNDITKQFVLIDRHARDPRTGLLYHGWDESKSQKWADKSTGLSPNVWARALGWYGMALVDVLDYFPTNHPGRDSIIRILNRFAKAVTGVQDEKTGLWYDVPAKPNEKKNYFEASASSMLVYTLAKGVRKGYLPAFYLNNAVKGYKGILKQFVHQDNGIANLSGTVSVSGLGGNPYRDGSFEYYMSEPVKVNDPKGVGAFINAANEIELIPTLKLGKGKNVVLDEYFNNEWKKDALGRDVRYHYTWNDYQNSGFSMLGNVFNNFGVKTRSLEVAPSLKNLQSADIYVIVDPDTEKETDKLHPIQSPDADVIASWVKAGGTLVLLGNDAGNADLKGLTKLSSKFGIKFNEDNFNLVSGNEFEQGSVYISQPNPVFKTTKKVYIKELSTLEITPPAYSIVKKNGKNIFAIAKYGKGSVLALGDPWVYNEYVDGRKLPAEFQNYNGAKEMVEWLISESKKK